MSGKVEDNNQRQITRLLVQDVLNEVAPEELSLVATYDPDKEIPGAASRGPLGFGVESGIVLLLPVVWKFFDAFLSEFVKESARSVAAKLKDLLFEGGNEPDRALYDSAVDAVRRELEESGIDKRQSPAVAATLIAVIAKNHDVIKKHH